MALTPGSGAENPAPSSAPPPIQRLAQTPQAPVNRIRAIFRQAPRSDMQVSSKAEAYRDEELRPTPPGCQRGGGGQIGTHRCYLCRPEKERPWMPVEPHPRT